MSRKNALRIMVAVVIALSGVSAFLQQTRPDLQPLWPITHKLAAWTGADPNYWWISEQELLFLRPDGRGDHSFVRHNIATSAELPLAALTKRFRDSGARPETVRLSPTGTDILWTGTGDITTVVNLDGKQLRTVPQPGPTLNVWRSDGIGWYALATDGQDVDHVSEHSLDPDDKTGLPRYLAFAFPNDPARVNMEHITTTDQNQLLVPYWNGARQITKVDVLVTGFGATMRDVHRLQFAPPYLNTGGELAFLPAVHRMAWRLNILLPRPQLLHDLGLLPSPRPSVGFWVTDQSNNATMALGYIDLPSGDPRDALSNLQLSPDGARVSFVYHHALWAVQLDR
jgi:hypothetical protein